MEDFFSHFPELKQKCTDTFQTINKKLSSPYFTSDKLSIDTLLPYLFTEITDDLQKELSISLCLYREIVDRYNKGFDEIEVFKAVLADYYHGQIITREQYKKINEHHRKFIAKGLSVSYLHSTERVFYRIEIFTGKLIVLPDELRKTILNDILEVSAFFLFDDDVYDLEGDLASDKNTILIQYLVNHNGKLEKAVSEFKEMLNALLVRNRNINPVLYKFIEYFKNVYQ